MPPAAGGAEVGALSGAALEEEQGKAATKLQARKRGQDSEAEADEPSFERPRTAQPRVLVSTPPRARIQSRSMVEVGSLLPA